MIARWLLTQSQIKLWAETNRMFFLNFWTTTNLFGRISVIEATICNLCEVNKVCLDCKCCENLKLGFNYVKINAHVKTLE